MSNVEPPDPEFEALLDYLLISRGFDFSGYKRSSLMRRVNKRRYSLALSNFGEYLDYLQVHPDEFEYLFNTILINVTSFFRDNNAWELLRTDILPRIFSSKGPNDSIRVWSAGCASGEEAYSLAMLMAEQLGCDDFHKRVKIYATDMDTKALSQARQASYSDDEIKDVPQELREKYFTKSPEGNYVFNSDLRRSVIFGEHDLMQDAPISRLDLLLCRNTLMYFNSESQGRILARFHFALNEGGTLFLGKAEMLLTHANLFTPVDMKNRIFTKVSRADMREHLLSIAALNDDQISNRLARLMRIRDIAFDNSPDAELIIDPNKILLTANSQAKRLFGITAKDISGQLHEMEVSYQPVALHPLIDRVMAEKKPITIPEVEMNLPSGENKYLDVHLIPLIENGNQLLGISVSYADISRSKSLEEKLKSSTTALETTNEELQSTNEELETTNEELQSTVEELETTNEELQSTNEELETMNEELQSTNEELETMNDELNERTNELNQSKSFLETILGNLNVGITVVDREFRLLNWNPLAEELWGLRSDEILGQSLLSLDIGLPVEKLKTPIRSVLDNKSDIQEVMLEAVNRRGKPIQCRVTCTPFTGSSDVRQGVVLMMEVYPNEK